MKAKIDGFKITFDLVDLVEDLNEEDRRTLARLVAAKQELFAGVLECVASDSHIGSYFTDGSGDWWFDSATLLELREKLLPLMPGIARGAVETALRQRNEARAAEKRMSDWAWRLFHARPESRWAERPYSPEPYKPAAEPAKEEVDRLMVGAAGT